MDFYWNVHDESCQNTLGPISLDIVTMYIIVKGLIKCIQAGLIRERKRNLRHNLVITKF